MFKPIENLNRKYRNLLADYRKSKEGEKDYEAVYSKELDRNAVERIVHSRNYERSQSLRFALAERKDAEEWMLEGLAHIAINNREDDLLLGITHHPTASRVTLRDISTYVDNSYSALIQSKIDSYSEGIKKYSAHVDYTDLKVGAPAYWELMRYNIANHPNTSQVLKKLLSDYTDRNVTNLIRK